MLRWPSSACTTGVQCLGVACSAGLRRVLTAAHVENGRVTSQDFATLSGLHELTPDLYPNRGGLGFVRLY